MQISKLDATPMRATRPWTVMGHLDATAPDLEPYEMKRVADLDQIDKSQSNVVLEVRHQPVNRTVKAIKAGVAAALAPGMAIAGVAGGAALLLSGAGVGLAAVAVVAGAAEAALTSSVSKAGAAQLRRLRWEPRNEEAQWKGTRTLELGAAPGERPTVVGESSSTKAPKGSELGAFLARTMKEYPAQRYAVILGGHGRARDSVGHIPVGEMAEATRIAHEASGRKVDTLLLDSCLVGNFETLLPMANDVRYAVVSEEPLYTGVFDWTSIINAIQHRPPSGQDFGFLAVHYSEHSRSPRTVSLVDMGNIPALRQSLESLGSTLNQAIDDGHRAPIAQAFKQATKIQDSGAIERTMENKLDLGSLLTQLASVPVPTVQAAAEEALQAYRGAVPMHSASQQFEGSTGLSIQGPQPWLGVKEYAKETGMPEWSRLLGNMKPLPLRVVHTAAEKVRSLLGQG